MNKENKANNIRHNIKFTFPHQKKKVTGYYNNFVLINPLRYEKN
jgi:hypothetical protein